MFAGLSLLSNNWRKHAKITQLQLCSRNWAPDWADKGDGHSRDVQGAHSVEAGQTSKAKGVSCKKGRAMHSGSPELREEGRRVQEEGAQSGMCWVVFFRVRRSSRDRKSFSAKTRT